jgi:hypothetical protein
VSAAGWSAAYGFVELDRQILLCHCISASTTGDHSILTWCLLTWSLARTGKTDESGPDRRSLVAKHTHRSARLKLLLASAGITNPSIRAALVDLLG